MKNIKDCPSEHNSESKLKMLKQVQHDKTIFNDMNEKKSL